MPPTVKNLKKPNKLTSKIQIQIEKAPLYNNQPTILIGFPNHLFEINEWRQQIKGPVHFILFDHPVFWGLRKNPGTLNFNRIKLIYTHAAVLAYLDYLKSQSTRENIKSVNLVSVDDILANPKIALSSKINELLKKDTAINSILYWDPVDVEISEEYMKYQISAGITKSISSKNTIQKLDSPLFLSTNANLAEYHAKHDTGRFTHSAFYDWQKTRFKEYKFPGHSYDTENRGSMPISVQVPPLPQLSASDKKYIVEAANYVSKHSKWGVPGRPGGVHTDIKFPVTHAATKDWFRNFLHIKLAKFGKYQDSIDGQGRNFLFHSCISPMINLGLITPAEVVNLTVEYYNAHKTQVGVANYEGFIRQVIGWREYQRYIYLYAGEKMRSSNYFGNNRRLTSAWYKGQLGVRPVDDAIRMAFRDGYLHHILRLMVVGNFMNLIGIHPTDAYKWFMEFALDSYDWVMVGNVYSMAMWADGGLSMRKPYISSDTYIMNMGTYSYESDSEGSSSESSDSSSSNSSYSSSSNSSYSSSSNSSYATRSRTRHSSQVAELGWNTKWYALFYDFIDRNQEKLKKTYYAGLVRAWKNKSYRERQQILSQAKFIIRRLTK